MKFCRRIGVFLAILLALCTLLLTVSGILLRLTLADQVEHWRLVAFFYLTPWHVLAAGLIPAFSVCWWRGWGRSGFALLLGIVGLLAAFLITSFRVSPDPGFPTKPGRVRIVCWNSDGYQHVDKGEAARAIARLRPDIFIAQEGVVDYGGQKAAFPPAFPQGWKMEYKPFSTMVISEGGLIHRDMKLKNFDRFNARALLTNWTIRGADFSFLIYDQRSDPAISRELALAELADFVAGYDERPLIVMGDFNTPSDSAHLQALRRHMKNAFEAVGNGFAGTWPLPFAPLAIDQAWYGEGVRALRCTHRSISLRGHQLVIFDFEIP